MSEAPYDAADNSERSYALWLAAAREMKIRSGQLPPDPDKAKEMRWASEGPRANVSDLDTLWGDRG